MRVDTLIEALVEMKKQAEGGNPIVSIFTDGLIGTITEVEYLLFVDNVAIYIKDERDIGK